MLLQIFIKSFTLTFLAEWGDRSQIATIGSGLYLPASLEKLTYLWISKLAGPVALKNEKTKPRRGMSGEGPSLLCSSKSKHQINELKNALLREAEMAVKALGSRSGALICAHGHETNVGVVHLGQKELAFLAPPIT
eukprot:825867-Pelagomonas_calceolata.AAC.3